jgi:hypothetical protein
MPRARGGRTVGRMSSAIFNTVVPGLGLALLLGAPLLLALAIAASATLAIVAAAQRRSQ